jgi:PAS domain S-box-containing protein
MAGIHLDITERKRTEGALRSQLRILELIAASQRLPNILNSVVAHVEEQLPEFVCSILLLNNDDATLHAGAAPNIPREFSESIEGLKIGPDVGSCGTAAYLRKTVIVSDIATDPLWKNYRDFALGFGFRSCWSAPIFAGGRPKPGNPSDRVLGTFALYGREPAAPTQEHLRIVSAAANLAGIAIQRHANEEAIRDSEDRLRTLLENLENVAVQAYEPNGTITFWNKASERVYGYAADEAMGQDIIQLLHSDETQSFERNLIASALQGIELPRPEEVEVSRQDGSRITTYTKRVLHRRPGRPPEFFRFDVDITDKKRAEQELAQRQAELFHTSRLSTLGQMVAALSHELAQPLTAIGNYASASAQMLGHPLPQAPEDLHSYVEAISHESQRCIAILQRLRDFSRRTPPRRSTCDARQLVEDAVDLVRAELRRRNVTLHMVFEEPLPPMIADQIQLQQVLVNLLTNAIDAVRNEPVGHRTIKIRMGQVSKEAKEKEKEQEKEKVAEELELVVADSGTGFSSDDLDRLFEPFFTTKPEGMGIGLNICQSIVRQHGGQIEARNNERGGATFVVRLPLTQE